PHAIADARVDAHDKARHRRSQWRGSLSRRRRTGQRANGARSLVERLDLEPIAIEPNAVLAARRGAPYDRTMHLVTDGNDLHWCVVDWQKPRDHGGAVDPYTVGIEDHLVLVGADPHQVPHAAPVRESGTSSQTVSTCAVCGNMSNACTLAMRYRGRRARSRASVAGSQLT